MELLDTSDRCFDDLGLVAYDAELIARREVLLDVVQPLLDVVDDLDGVGARLLANLQKNRRIAVDVGQCCGFSNAIVNSGDVVDLYRMPVDLAKDELAELLGRLHTSPSAHRDRLRALVNAAARDVGILGLEGAGHIINRHVVGSKPCGVDPHVDLPFAAAKDEDLSHAVGALEPSAQHLVCVLGHVSNRLFGRYRKGEDRRGIGVLLLNRRLVDGAGEQRKDPIDPVSNLLGGHVSALVQSERDDDLRDSFIVGIVSDTKHFSPGAPTQPELFISSLQAPPLFWRFFSDVLQPGRADRGKPRDSCSACPRGNPSD